MSESSVIEDQSGNFDSVDDRDRLAVYTAAYTWITAHKFRVMTNARTIVNEHDRTASLTTAN
jgi:hypothetical protein